MSGRDWGPAAARRDQPTAQSCCRGTKNIIDSIVHTKLSKHLHFISHRHVSQPYLETSAENLRGTGEGVRLMVGGGEALTSLAAVGE